MKLQTGGLHLLITGFLKVTDWILLRAFKVKWYEYIRIQHVSDFYFGIILKTM